MTELLERMNTLLERTDVLIDRIEWIRGLLIAVVLLQLVFMVIYFRSMNNMVDGFNQTIRGLQAVTDELQRLRRDRTS